MIDGPITDLSIIPLGSRVVIKQEDAPTKHGSIIVPETAKDKPQRGIVKAVGPGEYQNGVFVPNKLTVGDHVIYGKYAGSEVELNGDTLVVIKEADVFMITKKAGT